MKRDLNTLSKEQLVALFQQALTLHPDLDALLVLPTPGRNSSGGIDVEQVEREIGAVCRAADPRPGLRDWLAVASDHQRMGQRRAAGEVLAAFCRVVVREAPWIREIEAILEPLQAATRELGQVLAGAGFSARRRALSETIYDVLYWAVEVDDETAVVAAETLLAQAEPDLLATFAERADAAVDGAADDIERDQRIRAVELLTGATLDDEAFLELCRRTGRNSARVERLLSVDRINEALAVLADVPADEAPALADRFHAAGEVVAASAVMARRAEDSDPTGVIRAWLLARATERGDTAEQLRLAEALLWLSPSLERWRALRAAAAADPDALARVRAEFSRRHRYELLTAFSLDDGDLNVARGAWLRLPAAVKHSRGLSERMAEALAEEAPLDAAEILEDVAQHLADGRGRASLEAAAELLARARAILEAAGMGAAWHQLINTFQRRNRRLRGLDQVLEDSGLIERPAE